MLKKFFSFLIIGVFLSITMLPIQTNAQSSMLRTAQNKTSGSSDIKQVFSKLAAEDSQIRLDVSRLERNELNRSRQKFSGGQKTALYVGIAAVAAVIVIVLVSKNKKTAEPDGIVYAGCPGNPLCQ